MFFNNRQLKFPEEFRISSKWDYHYIIDRLNEENDEVAMLQRELKVLKYEIAELNGELKNSQDNSLDMDMMKEVILRVWRANNRIEFYKANNNLKRVESMIKSNEEFEDNEIKYITKNVNNSLKPLKYVENQLKAVLKFLEDNGFVIKDHTNSKYYDCMALNVLVFETDDTVEESTITETIKPSIFYYGELILNGEVVVTSPSS